jgi:hypothetical protein
MGGIFFQIQLYKTHISNYYLHLKKEAGKLVCCQVLFGKWMRQTKAANIFYY